MVLKLEYMVRSPNGIDFWALRKEGFIPAYLDFQKILRTTSTREYGSGITYESVDEHKGLFLTVSRVIRSVSKVKESGCRTITDNTDYRTGYLICASRSRDSMLRLFDIAELSLRLVEFNVGFELDPALGRIGEAVGDYMSLFNQPILTSRP